MDFEDTAPKANAPRAGRRAGRPRGPDGTSEEKNTNAFGDPPSTDNNNNNNDINPDTNNGNNNIDGGGSKSGWGDSDDKASKGWASSNNDTGNNSNSNNTTSNAFTDSAAVPKDTDGPIGQAKHGRRRAAELAEESRANASSKRNNNNTNNNDGDDSSDGIPEIPDLDDQGSVDDGDITKVVADAPKQRTNQIMTLSELESNSPLSLKSSEVNLGLLTSVLLPKESLKEEDDPWTRESLMAEVTYAINAEKERVEKELKQAKMDKEAELERARAAESRN